MLQKVHELQCDILQMTRLWPVHHLSHFSAATIVLSIHQQSHLSAVHLLGIQMQLHAPSASRVLCHIYTSNEPPLCSTMCPAYILSPSLHVIMSNLSSTPLLYMPLTYDSVLTHLCSVVSVHG